MLELRRTFNSPPSPVPGIVTVAMTATNRLALIQVITRSLKEPDAITYLRTHGCNHCYVPAGTAQVELREGCCCPFPYLTKIPEHTRRLPGLRQLPGVPHHSPGSSAGEIMEETMSCAIDAEIPSIPQVSIALDEVMHAGGFSDEDCLDTQLAVEEAMTNVIVHGYAGNPGQILITCRITDNAAELQIRDSAPPFDPLSIAEPDITEEIEERQIGGLGVFLIRRVMDEVSYRYEDGHNILVLVKKKKE